MSDELSGDSLFVGAWNDMLNGGRVSDASDISTDVVKGQNITGKFAEHSSGQSATTEHSVPVPVRPPFPAPLTNDPISIPSSAPKNVPVDAPVKQAAPLVPNGRRRTRGSAVVISSQKMQKFLLPKYVPEVIVIEEKISGSILKNIATDEILESRKTQLLRIKCVIKLQRRFRQHLRSKVGQQLMTKYLQGGKWSKLQSDLVFSLFLGWRIRFLMRSTRIQKGIKALNDVYEVLIGVISSSYDASFSNSTTSSSVQSSLMPINQKSTGKDRGTNLDPELKKEDNKENNVAGDDRRNMLDKLSEISRNQLTPDRERALGTESSGAFLSQGTYADRMLVDRLIKEALLKRAVVYRIFFKDAVWCPSIHEKKHEKNNGESERSKKADVNDNRLQKTGIKGDILTKRDIQSKGKAGSGYWDFSVAVRGVLNTQNAYVDTGESALNTSVRSTVHSPKNASTLSGNGNTNSNGGGFHVSPGPANSSSMLRTQQLDHTQVQGHGQQTQHQPQQHQQYEPKVMVHKQREDTFHSELEEYQHSREGSSSSTSTPPSMHARRGDRSKEHSVEMRKNFSTERNHKRPSTAPSFGYDGAGMREDTGGEDGEGVVDSRDNNEGMSQSQLSNLRAQVQNLKKKTFERLGSTDDNDTEKERIERERVERADKADRGVGRGVFKAKGVIPRRLPTAPPRPSTSSSSSSSSPLGISPPVSLLIRPDGPKAYVQLDILHADRLMPAKKGPVARDAQGNAVADRKPCLQVTLMMPAALPSPSKCKRKGTNSNGNGHGNGNSVIYDSDEDDDDETKGKDELKKIYYCHREYDEITLNPKFIGKEGKGVSVFYLPLPCPKKILLSSENILHAQKIHNEKNSLNDKNSQSTQNIYNVDVASNPFGELLHDDNDMNNVSNYSINNNSVYNNDNYVNSDNSIKANNIEQTQKNQNKINEENDRQSVQYQRTCKALMDYWGQGCVKIQVVDGERFNEDIFLGEVTLLLSAFLVPQAMQKKKTDGADANKPQYEVTGTYQLSKSKASDRVSGSLALAAYVHMPDRTYIDSIIAAALPQSPAFLPIRKLSVIKANGWMGPGAARATGTPEARTTDTSEVHTPPHNSSSAQRTSSPPSSSSSSLSRIHSSPYLSDSRGGGYSIAGNGSSGNGGSGSSNRQRDRSHVNEQLEKHKLTKDKNNTRDRNDRHDRHDINDRNDGGEDEQGSHYHPDEESGDLENTSEIGDFDRTVDSNDWDEYDNESLLELSFAPHSPKLTESPDRRLFRVRPAVSSFLLHGHHGQGLSMKSKVRTRNVEGTSPSVSGSMFVAHSELEGGSKRLGLDFRGCRDSEGGQGGQGGLGGEEGEDEDRDDDDSFPYQSPHPKASALVGNVGVIGSTGKADNKKLTGRPISTGNSSNRSVHSSGLNFNRQSMLEGVSKCLDGLSVVQVDTNDLLERMQKQLEVRLEVRQSARIRSDNQAISKARSEKSPIAANNQIERNINQNNISNTNNSSNISTNISIISSVILADESLPPDSDSESLDAKSDRNNDNNDQFQIFTAVKIKEKNTGKKSGMISVAPELSSSSPVSSSSSKYSSPVTSPTISPILPGKNYDQRDPTSWGQVRESTKEEMMEEIERIEEEHFQENRNYDDNVDDDNDNYNENADRYDDSSFQGSDNGSYNSSEMIVVASSDYNIAISGHGGAKISSSTSSSASSLSPPSSSLPPSPSSAPTVTPDKPDLEPCSRSSEVIRSPFYPLHDF